jgi:hypothetical protein
MRIDKFVIFSINLLEDFKYEEFLVEDHSTIKYVEIGIKTFIEWLDNPTSQFKE